MALGVVLGVVPMTAVATAAAPAAVPAAAPAHDPGNSYADDSVSTWDGVTSQIYRGQDATVSEFPAVIANLRAGGSRPKGQSCTGAVIGPRHVLTAAHCHDLAGAKTFLHGLDDLAVGTGTTLTTRSYVKHPRYTNWDQGYDVAVVTTNEDIPLPPEKWARYATSADAGIWQVGDTGRSYGYGKKTHDDVPADVSLDKQDFPIVDGASRCQGVAAGFKAATMICAGHPDGRTTILQGDSGGPFVVDGKIVGLASWSRSDFRWYGVFARLDNEMGDWVREQVGDPQPVEFGVAVDPSSLGVAAGESASGAVRTTAGAAPEELSLSAADLPPGAQAVFQPASITSGGAAKLTVTTSSSTPAGTYPVRVIGTSGSVSREATLTLTVRGTQQPGGLTVALSPSSASTFRGGSAFPSVVVTGASGPVALAAADLPPGVSVRFLPATVNPGETARAHVMTSFATPAGTYRIRVTATGGGKSGSADFTLTVT
ncbi:trypsin-like serine protease [Saccharothrix lopnurensis]|uniref:Trypsin-like serine protease n=1 Tax=Saccharothrix lopnurensis TaxID=1670621 RepID=A0ABW1NY48_9PSEU